MDEYKDTEMIKKTEWSVIFVFDHIILKWTILDEKTITIDVFQGLKHHGVVVIITAQLHSTKPELRFCAGSNPAFGMSEICNGEDP